MFFSIASCTATLALLASIPLSHAVDIPVIVGGPATLKFNPESVTAAVGDKIIFQFREKNHTATQSTLASPCVKAPGGFDSGFIPVAAGATDSSAVAEFTVTDANPVWVYCAQGTHCSAGMVFAINPGDKFAQYKATAMGQSAPPPTTGTPPAAGTGTDHKVVVGGPGKLAFEPASIKANLGDTITFEFRQKNHTVTQSTFASPCQPMTGGFDSGYMPVGEGAATFPTYQMSVKDAAPIWAYCKQGNHCGQGMVFAVNSVDTGANSFDAYVAKAKQQGSGAGTAASPTPTGGASRITLGSSLLLVVAAALGVVL